MSRYNDMVQMDQVHEASILDALRRRFLQNKIYTEVGRGSMLNHCNMVWFGRQ